MRKLFLIVCLLALLAPLASPAVPALQLAETSIGETPEACSATFCMRCADLCCPTSSGGCVCCSGD
jgi:hypothetical protein